MASIHDADVREFLMTGTRTGKLAFLAGDGRPLVAPVWFVLDGGDVVFTTPGASAKARALRRDPRMALVVDLPEPPYAYVQVQGTATFSEEPDELLRMATALGGRYMGAELAEQFGRRNGVPGELLVRLHPKKVLADFDVSG